MAAYAQYGYGYPTAASQFLTAPPALDVTSPPPAPPAASAPQPASSHPHPSASPLSDSTPTPMACPSLSPEHSHERDSGGSAASSSVGGTLTPDASSQIACQTPASHHGGGPPSAIGSFLPPPHDNPYNPAAAAAAVAFAAAPPCSAATACCDNGRPMISDPVSGQTVCSCQYDTAHFALSSYTRMQSAAVAAAAVGVGVGVGVYGSTYAAAAASEMSPYGVDGGPPGGGPAAAAGVPTGMGSQGNGVGGAGAAANVPLSPTSSAATAFYSSLSNPYALKDSSRDGDLTAGSPASWSTAGLQPTTGYYTYDPTFGAYGYGASYDLAARRKNATRESTATLKAWLNEHKKNPYPTKGEKIMLAIITKMTLTQVSTWFANARRRLKKENKMTWEPKNRSEDDDDALVSEEEMERERSADTPTTGKEAAAAAENQRYGGGSGGASLAAGGSASKLPPAAPPTQSGRSSAPMMASAAGGAAAMEAAAIGSGGVGVGAPPVKDPLRSVYYPDQTQYYHSQPHHQAHHPHQQQPSVPPTQPHPHHLQPFNHQPYRHQLQPSHASYAVHAGGGGSPYRSASMYEDHVLSQGQQHHHGHPHPHHHHSPYADYAGGPLKEEHGPPGEQATEVKPKIWSLADTAAELATPPPPTKSFLEGRPPPDWLGDYGSMGGPGYQAELVATIAMQSNVRQYGTPPPPPPPLAGPGAMGPYRGRGPPYGHAGSSGMPLRLERYEDHQAVREERHQEGGASGSGGGASVELQHERDVSFKRQHCA